jgi:hypothetical protein
MATFESLEELEFHYPTTAGHNNIVTFDISNGEDIEIVSSMDVDFGDGQADIRIRNTLEMKEIKQLYRYLGRFILEAT